MAITIYLFRHGQSEFNLTKTFTGWLDAKLTPLGLSQAQTLGQILRDKKINLAYTSRLSRAQDTLNQVLAYHPECRQTIIDDRLIERSYGDLAGHTHQEIIDQYGQDQFDRWHRGWTDQPPGGESLADVEIRVRSFITDLRLARRSLGEGGSTIHDLSGVAISAHGNSIRVFRKIMENTSQQDACSWTIPYDRYYQYTM